MNLVRRRAGEALYAVTDLPVALVGTVLSVVTAGVGLLLVPLFVGVPVLAAGLVGARGWGRFERARAAVLLGTRVPAPSGSRPVEALRLGRWLRSVFGDAVSWRAVLYLVLRAPLAVVTTGVATCVYGGAGLCLSYPFWYTQTHMSFGSYDVDTVPRVAVTAVVGLVLLGVGPPLLLAPLALCRLAVRFLLGPSRLDERVHALERSRGTAVDASAAALRRIERDLHDGTQARLVTLAMDLGLARDLLSDLHPDDRSPAAAQLRAAVEAAHRNAQDAVVELRGVVADIHPPVLDTGLEPALHSLAEGLSIPVSVAVRLHRRPPPAVETIVYFCAVELLGNVAVDALRIPVDYLAGLFTAGDPVPVRSVLNRLAAMRAYQRRVNLGEPRDESIAAAVGMTGAEMDDMYRLLAIAKYEERYVIPAAHAEDAHRLEQLGTECSLEYEGGPGMGGGGPYGQGPFGESSGTPAPIQVETFHMLRERQTADEVTDPGDEPRRLNLLTWDGKGRPAGLFPPRRDTDGSE